MYQVATLPQYKPDKNLHISFSNPVYSYDIQCFWIVIKQSHWNLRINILSPINLSFFSLILKEIKQFQSRSITLAETFNDPSACYIIERADKMTALIGNISIRW